MDKKEFTSDMILDFNKYLSTVQIDLPEKYNLINPYNGETKYTIEQITQSFYHKFYMAYHKYFLLLYNHKPLNTHLKQME